MRVYGHADIILLSSLLDLRGENWGITATGAYRRENAGNNKLLQCEIEKLSSHTRNFTNLKVHTTAV